MEKKITLEEVLTFSEQFGFEMQGVGLLDVLFIIIAVALLVLAIISIFTQPVGIAVFGAPACVILILIYHGATSVESEQRYLYKDKQREWEVQYVEPYVDSLPVIEINNIKSITYNSEFESKTKSKANRDPSYKIPENTVPIKVTKNSGEIIEVWATVKPLGEKEVETLEYKYIPKDLLFHEISGVPLYREGYYEVVLYTDRKI